MSQNLNEDLRLFLNSYNVPNELIEIVKLRTIVEEPFNERDIYNIIDDTGNIGILYGLNHDSKIVLYGRINVHNDNIEKISIKFTGIGVIEPGEIIFMQKSVLGYRAHISDFNSTGAFLPRESSGIFTSKGLRERLIGRFDLSIVRDSDEILYIDGVPPPNDEKVLDREADVVLLSLPSVTWIFYKRFQLYGYKDPMKLAVKYTREFFDNIVNSISNDFDLPLLFNYMILNVQAYGWELDKEDIKYINEDPMYLDKEYFDNIYKCCNKYYDIIWEYIDI